MSVPIVATAAIQRPTASGTSGGGYPGQLEDPVGSGYESEDEDDNDPPVVINYYTQPSFTQELVVLDRNLGSLWDAPESSDRKGCTDHGCRRSGLMQIESAKAD
jgi:hypothetical protein